MPSPSQLTDSLLKILQTRKGNICAEPNIPRFRYVPGRTLVSTDLTYYQKVGVGVASAMLQAILLTVCVFRQFSARAAHSDLAAHADLTAHADLATHSAEKMNWRLSIALSP